jgi:hypothetical protein
MIGSKSKKESVVCIFPNPVHESLQISGLDGDVPFSIYNHVGALVQKGRTAGDIDVFGLPQGVCIC